MTPRHPSKGREALARARNEIARIDRDIVQLIARRVSTAERVARAKRQARLPVMDPEQEARVVRRAAQLARAEGLSEEDVRDCFWRLIALTRKSQDGAG